MKAIRFVVDDKGNRTAAVIYCPKCEIKWDTGMLEGGD